MLASDKLTLPAVSIIISCGSSEPNGLDGSPLFRFLRPPLAKIFLPPVVYPTCTSPFLRFPHIERNWPLPVAEDGSFNYQNCPRYRLQCQSSGAPLWLVPVINVGPRAETRIRFLEESHNHGSNASKSKEGDHNPLLNFTLRFPKDIQIDIDMV
uniref:Uncharacterized protein n=1 Tax=Nelumbo nucifera TaxID=4432 RepID=A0A822ZLG9_NELNU|nr:TPA_asm: hypothetical protein HUJ06_002459 [Nelumbo nucifera]